MSEISKSTSIYSLIIIVLKWCISNMCFTCHIGCQVKCHTCQPYGRNLFQLPVFVISSFQSRSGSAPSSQLTCEQDPGHLNFFTWGSSSLPTQIEQSFIFRQSGFRLGATDSDLSHFILCCKLTQYKLEVTVWWSQQNHIIWKRLIRNSEFPKPDALPSQSQLQEPTPTENKFDNTHSWFRQALLDRHF